MNRKSPAMIIICLVCSILLAGCGSSKPAEIDLKEKLENVSISSEEEENNIDNSVEEEGSDIKQNSDRTEETEESRISAGDLDLAGAFENGQVYNNGSYFVRIKDKVYFRNILPESMDKGAAFGEFLRTEYNAVSCPLISYDINTCKWSEIGTLEGTGELYACPGGFIVGAINPNMFDASCTNLYDPVTKETSFYCKGLPLGISKSGRILAVEEYDGQNIYKVLYKDGEEIARLSEEKNTYQYVGFSGETLIVMCCTADMEYVLCSVDEEGNITELGMIGNTDHGYGEPKELLTFNDDIYVCIGYYEGSGHFLSRWEVVKAVPGVKGSLVLAMNNDGDTGTYDEEGSDPDVPVIYIDETGTLDTTDHLPYTVFMGNGDKENDLFYYNEVYDKYLLAKDFIDRSDPEKCSIIQDMESITETAFVIYADAEADSEYDIGWRMGYRMTGWHICAIPFDNDHLDDEGMAGNIIHFENEGSND